MKNKKGVITVVKRYDLEYKEYVSRMIVEEGRRQIDVAHELNISSSSISRWVKEYKNKVGWDEADKQNGEDKVYKTPMEYEKELEEKKKEFERLTRENEILRKSMDFFTKNKD